MVVACLDVICELVGWQEEVATDTHGDGVAEAVVVLEELEEVGVKCVDVLDVVGGGGEGREEGQLARCAGASGLDGGILGGRRGVEGA
eukprot:scaffold7662_cov77-Skeletonema_dohrnii-CCMP3373.AAC.2